MAGPGRRLAAPGVVLSALTIACLAGIGTGAIPFPRKSGNIVRMLPGATGRVKSNTGPGTLILVRNGLPNWGLPDERFIGWADPDLSEEGQMEVRSAARLLVESGHTIDTVHTSHMKRSIRTVWIILHELERIYLPVSKDWRLAARRCGALTGLDEEGVARRWGETFLSEMRTSIDARPPTLREAPPDSEYRASKERPFVHLVESNDILDTETISEALERVEPAWKSIAAQLGSGKNVLVVGHQLSLAAIVAEIEGLSKEQADAMISIPRGCPLIYRFQKGPKGALCVSEPSESAMKKTAQRCAAFVEHFGPGRNREPVLPRFAEFLADPSDLERMSREQTSLRDAPTCITSGAFGTELCAVGPSEDMERAELELASSAAGGTTSTVSGLSREPVTSLEIASGRRKSGDQPQVVAIIRHGKTEHNKLGLFTGWEDVPLAAEGAAEAMAAGRLLAQHGVQFDVVYTSWLSRSISTAWLVLEQLDALWLPIVKSWRLNERMYGRLTGLSKRMVRTKFGEQQFKMWRRGYTTRPPPVSSFSPMYPGNDDRYVTYVTDVRNSVRETVIRSIEAGHLELHPKLPKHESLKDCMERTIPYWRDVIAPEAIHAGKSVLIASSENAIRGLMMHLCDIPPDKIVGVEIPTGVPLIYDVKSKCIRILDDGSGVTDPLEKYNFGSNGHLLFQPCQVDPDDEAQAPSA